MPDDSRQLTEDWLLDGRVRLVQPAHRLSRRRRCRLAGGGGGGAARRNRARCRNRRRRGGALPRRAGVRDRGHRARRRPRHGAAGRPPTPTANGASRRVRFFTGDLMTPPIRLAPASFDHVMANPPYMAQGTVRQSPHPQKAAATVESTADLDDWVRFCVLMVRHKGVVTMIHRADRLVHVLEAFSGRARRRGGVSRCGRAARTASRPSG